MRFFSALALKKKLIGSMLLVTFFALSIGFAVVIANDIAEFRSSLRGMSVVKARLVAEYCVGPLAFGDREGAEKILASLANLPSVSNAYVYDKDGVLFAGYSRGGEAPPSRPALSEGAAWFENQWLHVVEPVLFHGESYGAVYLRASTAPLDSKIMTYLGTMGVLMLLLLFLAYLVARRLQALISRPVLDLADVSRLITTEGDYSFRVLKSAHDEIGVLYDAFNGMMDHIAHREKERDKALDALYREKERAQVTLQSIGDGVITTDTAGVVQYLNTVAEQLTGWTSEEACGRAFDSVFRIISEISRDPLENPVERCLRAGRIVGIANHSMLIRRDGEEIAIENSAAPIRDQSGDIIGVVIVFRDVTVSRKLIQQISYQARYDALTGLVNRREFEERLARVIDNAKKHGGEHALLYMDLDQFKVVNDTCGHMAGDELLRQVTVLLQGRLRQRDTFARFGGDEFTVLLEHCPPARAMTVAEELREAVQSYRFVWEENSFAIGVSVGLVAIDKESGTLNNVLSLADSACYAAKEAGRNRIYSYHEDGEAMARRHTEMRWVSRISRGLEEGRFCLARQPIAPLHGGPDEGEHYEILLRMKDTEGNLIQPGAFLGAAERYSLSPALDRWVIRETFAWLRAHPERVERLRLCAINLSGHTLADEHFLKYMEEQIDGAGIAPERICFEITETAAIVNLTRAMRFMRALKKRGCCFALDDFGSGMSSFLYLRNLPVDFLKIDGAFVKDIHNDAMDYAMVKSINEIGHVMGMRTIAEFVEGEEILAKLREIGVDYGQGYCIGRPRLLETLTVPE